MQTQDSKDAESLVTMMATEVELTEEKNDMQSNLSERALLNPNSVTSNFFTNDSSDSESESDSDSVFVTDDIQDVDVSMLLEAERTTQLSANVQPYEADKELDVSDFYEARRRFTAFRDKWECILWIDHYEETYNALPTKEQVSVEFRLTIAQSNLYLETYADRPAQQKIDLDELLHGFNVHYDCVVWWKLIVYELKNEPRSAIWLIFEEVAQSTPTPMAMQLLEHYKFDLTRFDEQRVNKVCQNLVIGSEYPICAALMISKWMQDRATFDISRAEVFELMADDYIAAALEYLSIVESDHLATILLETKSNIGGMSAMDMANEFELHTFVTNNRIEPYQTQ